MRVTSYRLKTERPGIRFKAAVVADLHDHPYDDVLAVLKRERPELILIPGDLTESLDRPSAEVSRPGLRLLAESAAIAPTFYSLGNHEIGGCHSRIYKARIAGQGELAPFVMRDDWREAIRKSGAVLLDGDFLSWKGLVIGGLGSGLLNPGWVPELDWLADYANTPGYKLLLCHHPEYYHRYLRLFDIDLTVSGHAHGGQWRLFGRGVYAPDQGLFPRYTSGLHENRLIISSGVVNTVPFAPRFFNPCEVVTVEVEGNE